MTNRDILHDAAPKIVTDQNRAINADRCHPGGQVFRLLRDSERAPTALGDRGPVPHHLPSQYSRAGYERRDMAPEPRAGWNAVNQNHMRSCAFPPQVLGSA